MENSLLFLLSLPRSGSTLVQQMLGCSSKVHTEAETWMLLPLLYIFQNDSTLSDFWYTNGQQAISEFLARKKSRKEIYLSRISEMFEELTEIGSSRKQPLRYFLEKTPRNLLVKDELLEAFPHAKYILLTREPISILSSMSKTWCRGRWAYERYRIDFEIGLPNLISLLNNKLIDSLHIRFENLMADPITELKRICVFLGIPYEDKMIESFRETNVKGSTGDKTGLQAFSSVEPSRGQTNWKHLCNSVRRKQFCEMVSNLGKEAYVSAGFDFDEYTRNISNPRQERLLTDMAYLSKHRLKKFFFQRFVMDGKRISPYLYG
ncbi:MAG: sulfotransferase [Verrucomicrobiota bacterium]